MPNYNSTNQDINSLFFAVSAAKNGQKIANPPYTETRIAAIAEAQTDYAELLTHLLSEADQSLAAAIVTKLTIQ